MSNESTKTTLAGLMENARVYVNQNIGQFSTLWNSPYIETVQDVNVVQFGYTDNTTLTGTVDAVTDGTDPTARTITINNTDATLNLYSAPAKVTYLALNGGSNIASRVANDVGRVVGNTVDKAISDAALSVSGAGSVSATSGLGLGELMAAKGELLAKGFRGPFVLYVHPKAYEGGLKNDVVETVCAPDYNDGVVQGQDMLGVGYQGTIDGVEIWVSQFMGTHDSGTYAYNILFDRGSLGFGYKDVDGDVVELMANDAPELAASWVIGQAYCVPKALNTTGGYLIDANIS